MPSAPLRVASALAGICLAVGLASCTAAPTLSPAGGAGPRSGGAIELRASAARSHMEALANGIGDRYSGTDAERRAADYVGSAFERMGYTVETQSFSFGRRGMSANVLATKPGASSGEIIVGAHYDSGDEGDGADDNASGVGVLLAAAEEVRDVETPYTITFVAFGAEEADDLYGSGHFVDQLDQSGRDNVVAMVNLDSISAGDIPYVYGDADDLREWIQRAADQAGQRMDTVPVSSLHGDADYYPFQRAGIPFVYFEATNWNLGRRDGFTQVDPRFADDGAIIHTRYDTVSFLDDTFPGRIDERLALYTTVLTRVLTEYQG